MLTLFSLQSLIRQLVRLSPDPSEQFPGRRRRPTQVASVGRCGLCPICREMVLLEAPAGDAADTCPRCGGMIDHLDPIAGA